MTTIDLTIPDRDAAEFGNLEIRNKQAWMRWNEEFSKVATGTGRIQDRLAAVAERMGVTPRKVRHTYDQARKLGWRGVIDWRVERRREESEVPQEFRDWFKGLCEAEQRSCRQAWSKVVTLWQNGNDIPGYKVRPEAGPNGLPPGWSYANAMRHAPTRNQRKLFRVGRSAADMPLLITTRAGLPVGKIYMFDDVWHDVLVNYVGVAKRNAIRPLELACIDLASTAKVLYGLRPRLTNEDGSHDQIKEKEMRLLVTAVLLKCGYRRDGTIFTVEHGTAAIRKDFEDCIKVATGGLVTVQRGGILDKALVPGGWGGPKRGNFRLKASLESLHALGHNARGLLPGQTGSNSRENKPEKLSGIEQYNNQLLREIENLPMERLQEIAAKLQFPLLHWHEYHKIMDDIYRWLDLRTGHELEGWQENLWTKQEYRLDPTDMRWLPATHLQLLPQENREVVLSAIERPGCMRIRKLSPAEVWEQGRSELIYLKPEMVPMLLGPDLAMDKSVGANGCFVMDQHELTGGASAPLRFPAHGIRNVLGQQVMLDTRKTYKVFVNPFDTGMLFVCDEGLRYIGYVRRQIAVSRADMDALHAAMGEASHRRTDAEREVRVRHAPEADERAAMVAHNQDVVGTITGGVMPGKARRVTKADDAVLAEIAQRPDPDAHVEDEGEQVTKAGDLADMM
jgi:hypothetical protein